MDLGLTNATAVVVGGGRGMGLASARCLADDGARIAIIARSRDDLDAATADLTDRGSPDAVGIVADIRDADRVNGVFADLGERWNGELNVLVNAVGPGAAGGFEDLSDEQWSQAFDEGGMGADRQLLGALDATPKCHSAGLHRGQGRADERLQELVAAAGQGRDSGQRRVAG